MVEEHGEVVRLAIINEELMLLQVAIWLPHANAIGSLHGTDVPSILVNIHIWICDVFVHQNGAVL